MRVVCMVPSWTETLIACGVNVVGRTRYCIHPASQVASIPEVGGTKDIHWEKVKAVRPDILVFDQEENPRVFAEKCPYPWVATHVDSVLSVAGQLEKLAVALECTELKRMAERWRQVAKFKVDHLDWDKLPGVKEWWVRPGVSIQSLEYVIWRKPWMVVSRHTFIGSMLEQLGLSQWLENHSQKYPEVDLDSWMGRDRLLMFSSEPYDFAKHREEFIQRGFPSVLVDGELFSWFGIRSLEFLESLKK